ncbi:hypothetical protein [Enhydrobacter sp.]|jgi:GMP synthase PP-ATPase subunit|uniref:hypothetical protein n=1 Tax=Enhydrobacter sp. TaxID=1894999 RepID=UPI002638EED0|nr:hypothetical protein [Enhydrobacter sp.]WIM09558.1 MAG: hypothetical protein OJF58_000511 [Enhydrobacter sp.]
MFGIKSADFWRIGETVLHRAQKNLHRKFSVVLRAVSSTDVMTAGYSSPIATTAMTTIW